jgi:hypothetical protein
MKPLIIAIALLSLTTLAYGACRQWTILNSDGTITTCTQCCNASGHCTISCF